MNQFYQNFFKMEYHILWGNVLFDMCFLLNWYINRRKEEDCKKMLPLYISFTLSLENYSSREMFKWKREQFMFNQSSLTWIIFQKQKKELFLIILIIFYFDLFL